MKIGLPVMLIYLISDVGSIGGGWLSSNDSSRHSVNFAKVRHADLLAECCSHCFRISHRNLWIAVFLIGLAAAGHQGFSANLFT